MNAEQVERLRERAIGELRMADDAADEETAGVINHLAAGEGRLAYVPLREKADVARTVFNSIRRRIFCRNFWTMRRLPKLW